MLFCNILQAVRISGDSSQSLKSNFWSCTHTILQTPSDAFPSTDLETKSAWRTMELQYCSRYKLLILHCFYFFFKGTFALPAGGTGNEHKRTRTVPMAIPLRFWWFAVVCLVKAWLLLGHTRHKYWSFKKSLFSFDLKLTVQIRNIHFYLTLAIFKAGISKKFLFINIFYNRLQYPSQPCIGQSRLHSYCPCNAFTVSLDTGRVLPSSQARDINNHSVRKSFDHRGTCQRLTSTRNRSYNP